MCYVYSVLLRAKVQYAKKIKVNGEYLEVIDLCMFACLCDAVAW